MELDRETVLADLDRIARWLAGQTGNDEAQGAASDLNAIAEYLRAWRVAE